MRDIGFHIRLRLVDDRVLVQTPHERRILAKVVMSKGEPFGLFVFSTPDSHLHLGASCTRSDCGRLAQRISVSLRRRLGIQTRFSRAYIGAMKNAKHLYNSFHYILGQQRRHQLRCDPFQEGSNLPDLLGLRLVGRHTIRKVRKILPRVRREELMSHLGVDSLKPVEDPSDCLELLPRAGIMAAAVSDLDGLSRDKIRARRAIIEIARSHASVDDLMNLLSVSRRTIYRLLRTNVDPSLVYATRLQLDLLRKKKHALREDEPFIT
jgi:hypothetical protein